MLIILFFFFTDGIIGTYLSEEKSSDRSTERHLLSYTNNDNLEYRLNVTREGEDYFEESRGKILKLQIPN